MENENLYTFENPEYRKTFWHTSSHVMAQAVKRLWPEVQLAIGPAIDGRRNSNITSYMKRIVGIATTAATLP